MKTMLPYLSGLVAIILLTQGLSASPAGAAAPAPSSGEVAAAPGSALAPPPAEPRPANSTSRIWSIAGSALRPRDSGVNFAADSSGGGAYPLDNPFKVWNAPVHLPQGAVVNTVTMFYYDTSTSNRPGFFTIYDRQTAAIVTEWAMSSSGSSGAGSAFATVNQTIDNTQHAYMVNWRPNMAGGSIQLRGFQIICTVLPGASGTIVIPLY